jgi:GxxExxY protein
MNTNELIKKKYANTLLFKEEVYTIIGAAMEVHTQLGCGFLEAVYQEALMVEFANRCIPVESQKELPIRYKGIALKKGYIADFIAFNKIIIELKAASSLTTADEAQVINYLKATGLELGLLINFGAEKLEWSRKILTNFSS